jgi:cytochrome c
MPTEGMHDIYFVFTNSKAKQGGSLMIVMNTTFKMDDPGTTQTTQKEMPKADLNDYVGKYKMTNLPFPLHRSKCAGWKVIHESRRARWSSHTNG